MFVKGIKSRDHCNGIASQRWKQEVRCCGVRGEAASQRLAQILLLMDLAAVGEALVWPRHGDSHLDCRMKTDGYLLNVCVDERCLDQTERGKNPPAPKSLLFPNINHKNNCK